MYTISNDRMSTRRAHPNGRESGEPPIGELFRQLSDDATRLIRQEIALGKAELREAATTLGRSAMKVGVAAGLGLLGALAAVAFLILALGDLIDNYWLSALLVAVTMLGVAAIMGRNAMENLKSGGLKPTQTLETLKADADWAKRELATVRQEWKSETHSNTR